MSHFFFTIIMALRAVRANRVRSGLTVLGIVIGITYIMLIVSLGDGAKRLILGEIQGLGAETIIVRPGQKPSGPSDFAQTLFSDSIKDREVALLRKKEFVPDHVASAPVLFVTGSVSYESEVARPTIYGWSAEFMASMMKVKVAGGQLFDEEDIKQSLAVAVIGSEVKEDLFGNEDPIGQAIRIEGKNFRVVAHLAPGGGGLFNTNKLVVVPYTTALNYLSSGKHYNEVMVKVSSPEVVPRAVEDITRALRDAHNITDPEKDDFYIETQQAAIDQIRTILSVLTAFLSAVVAISLLVGGIGVMNVMLVSVTERTKEIGLRKALGARRRDILLQFLMEAVILTGLGGVVGIFLGVTLGYIVATVLSSQLGVEWEFVLPWKAGAIGLSTSFLVGIIFGLYPARSAAKKSPIEALRYE